MKKNINLLKYLSKQDIENLKDKNRSVPGKSKVVKRCYYLVKKAKGGDIDARNTLYYLVYPLLVTRYRYYSTILEFDDYMQDCFFIVNDTINAFNPVKSNNFINLVKMNLHNTMINMTNTNIKKVYMRVHTKSIETFQPNEVEKILTSIDENLTY